MKSLRLSVIVIGLNEGPRLRRALRSVVLATQALPFDSEIIYVDSGSTDGSFEYASSVERVRSVRVMTRPACAASARNLGIEMARGEFIQLLDGDMELAPGWLTAALGTTSCDDIAAVVGTLVEARLHSSVWNCAFGLDWNSPPGRTDTLGGAALWRTSVLRELGGFDESLRVGEDPELCLRTRKAGYGLLRLEETMARHDLDLNSGSQYCRRALAVGESRANVARKHLDSEWARTRLLQPIRGASMVLATLALLPAFGLPALPFVATVITLTLGRRAYLDRRRGWSLREACIHSVHVYAVKVPVAAGALRALAARETPSCRAGTSPV